jgi:DNA polymerase V
VTAHSRLALVDCNNFYVSCEQAFNPALRHKPVLVLSNNDGCVVSRSAEAKAVGVPMAVPYFKIRDSFEALGGVALSSNYALYADMSRRAMRLMQDMADSQEIYSIDECFLDFSSFSHERALDQALAIRRMLWQHLSLPVCIGLGATKTQAKLANQMAKDFKEPSGICDLGVATAPLRQNEMQAMPVNSVWGIGRRTAQTLADKHIVTVGDLLRAPESLLRKSFAVTLTRTRAELAGQSCFVLETAFRRRQQIIASRSFGRTVSRLEDLSEALSTFATRAAERLREDGSLAGSVQVYITGNRFKAAEKEADRAIMVMLDSPTDDTRDIVGAALNGLQEIYCPTYRYKKAGVVLGGIVAATCYQPDLLATATKYRQPSPQLMQAMDRINQRYGRDRIRVASVGNRDEADWHMSCSRRSPRYTTSLSELPVFSSIGMRS